MAMPEMDAPAESAKTGDNPTSPDLQLMPRSDQVVAGMKPKRTKAEILAALIEDGLMTVEDAVGLDDDMAERRSRRLRDDDIHATTVAELAALNVEAGG